jgi:hypothetical protein
MTSTGVMSRPRVNACCAAVVIAFETRPATKVHLLEAKRTQTLSDELSQRLRRVRGFFRHPKPTFRQAQSRTGILGLSRACGKQAPFD